MRTPFSRCLIVFGMVVSCLGATPKETTAQWYDHPATLPPALILTSALPTHEATQAASYTRLHEKHMSPSASGMGLSHKYLGYGTLLLAAGAAFSSSNEDVHEPLGYAAASAATLTCFTGFLEYSDYFDLDEGYANPYNIHIAAGVAATAGFIITAVLGANGDGHGGIGAGSAVLMCVPIVVLKW